MSQENVERVLGRLVTDGAFRRRFRRDPSAALRTAGLALAEREREALLALPPALLERFGAALDGGIARFEPEPTPSGDRAEEPGRA